LVWSQRGPLYYFSLLFFISPPSLLPFLFLSFGTLQVRKWRWQLEPPLPLPRARASDGLVIDAHSSRGTIYALFSRCYPSHHRCFGCHHPNRLIIVI